MFTVGSWRLGTIVSCVRTIDAKSASAIILFLAVTARNWAVSDWVGLASIAWGKTWGEANSKEVTRPEFAKLYPNEDRCEITRKKMYFFLVSSPFRETYFTKSMDCVYCEKECF